MAQDPNYIRTLSFSSQGRDSGPPPVNPSLSQDSGFGASPQEPRNLTTAVQDSGLYPRNQVAPTNLDSGLYLRNQISTVQDSGLYPRNQVAHTSLDSGLHLRNQIVS